MINSFGKLDASETISFLATRNKVERFLISIPDPNNNEKYIDIYERNEF